MKLTSPNHPELYDPLEHCKWTINAPTGHFVSLDFEEIFVSIMWRIEILNMFNTQFIFMLFSETFSSFTV